MIKERGFWLLLGGIVAMVATFFLMTPAVAAGSFGEIVGARSAGVVFNFSEAQKQTLAFSAGATSAIVGAVLYAAGVIEEAVMRAGGFRRAKPKAAVEPEEV